MKRSSLVMCDGVRRAASGSAAGIGRRAPADRGSRSPSLGGRVIQPTACPAVNRSRAHASTASPGETADTELRPIDHAGAARAEPGRRRAREGAAASSAPRSRVPAARRRVDPSGRAPRCAQTPERTASTSSARTARVEAGRELGDRSVQVVATWLEGVQREVLDDVVDPPVHQRLVDASGPEDEPAHAGARHVRAPHGDPVDEHELWVLGRASGGNDTLPVPWKEQPLSGPSSRRRTRASCGSMSTTS